jgi:hypothetical protein
MNLKSPNNHQKIFLWDKINSEKEIKCNNILCFPNKKIKHLFKQKGEKKEVKEREERKKKRKGRKERRKLSKRRKFLKK